MKYIKRFEDIQYHGYEGSMGAGVTPCCVKTGRFLVGLRGEKVTMPHTWSTFGGSAKHRQTPEEAAIEELWEETQYQGEIKLIEGYVYKDRSYIYHNFIGLVPEEYVPNLEDPEYPGEFENEDAIWVSLQELYDLEPKHYGFAEFVKESKHLFEKYGK